jgi:hypothetical protein
MRDGKEAETEMVAAQLLKVSEYEYKCSLCGHKWRIEPNLVSEKRRKRNKRKQEDDYNSFFREHVRTEHPGVSVTTVSSVWALT